MQLRVKKDILCDVSIFLYIFSVFVWSNMSSTRMLYYACTLFAVLTCGFDIIKYRRVVLDTEGFFSRFINFGCVSFFLSAFGVDFSHSTDVVISILMNSFVISIILNHIILHNKAEFMVKSFGLAAFFMGVYLLISEGFGRTIRALVGGARIGGTIANENIVGIVSAIAVVIALHYIKNEKQKRWILTIPLEVLFVLASGSRMAVILLFVGCLVIVGIDINIKTILRTLVIIGLVLALGYYLLSRPEFSVIRMRMEDLLGFIKQGNTTNKSMNYRLIMMQLGISQFLENPLFGLGIGNSGTLLYGIIDNTYYLHNNYVELLASVGIIGSLLYYRIHFGVISFFLSKRKMINNRICLLAIVLIIMILINDFSNVMYYKTEGYYMLAMLYAIKSEVRRRNGVEQ